MDYLVEEHVMYRHLREGEHAEPGEAMWPYNEHYAGLDKTIPRRVAIPHRYGRTGLLTLLNHWNRQIRTSGFTYYY